MSPIEQHAHAMRQPASEVRRVGAVAMLGLCMTLCALLAAAQGLYAAAVSDSMDSPHIHVQLLVPDQSLTRGQTTQAGVYFRIEPGWHIYWMNAGDAGEPPRIRWTLPEGISAGPLQFPAPRRLPLGPLMDFGYEGEVLFPLTLSVAKTEQPGPAKLHARLDWLVCEKSCVPGKAELELSREVSDRPVRLERSEAETTILRQFATKVPKPFPAGFKAEFQPNKEGFRLSIETGRSETSAVFFPAEQHILSNAAAQTVTPAGDGLIVELKKDSELTVNPSQLAGVLELSGGRAYELEVLPGTLPVDGKPNSKTTAARPVQANPPEPAFETSVSASTPVRFNGHAPSESALPTLGKILTLAFLGGLVLNLMPCVFPVLFLKGLALVQSGNEERRKMRLHGLVYAAGILASFWVLVAVLLVLRTMGSQLGWGFQFQSPVFLSMMAGFLFFLGLSLAGQFEIGLTLTSAGGSLASKQGLAGSFFTGVLAVVVATPCTAPFMGAAIGYALSQPAGVTFAVFSALAFGLAAPYVALTLQPAWTRLLPRPGVWMEVLKQAVAVPIFATVIWLAWLLAQAYGAAMLAALLVSFLLLAIAGWSLGRWPARRWAKGIALLNVIAVVAICVIAPSRFTVSPQASAQETHDGWETWSPEAVARYQALGRPVFVDFTAGWCLSCQVNERVALNQPSVQKALADGHVALLRADWTQHDETIARQLTALGRRGVPAYALYAPGQTNPRLLPEVLTPGIVIDALGKLASSSELKDHGGSN